MKRKSIVGLALALVVIALSVIAVISLPTGSRPWCQKQFDPALIQWMMADGQTNWQQRAGTYPNAEGREKESIALFGAYVKGGDRIGEDYGYVPGLCESDRDDLVLMYMKRRTRYRDGWVDGYEDECVQIFTKEDFAYHKVSVAFWQTDENDEPAYVTEPYPGTFTPANVKKDQDFYTSDLEFTNGAIQDAYVDRGRHAELADPKYYEPGAIFDIMALVVIQHGLQVAEAA